MRIGIDAACWANGRGYGRFSREIARELVALAPEDEFVFFLDPLALQRFDLDAPNARRVTIGDVVPPAQAAAADGYRSPADMLRFTRAVWRERVDVFFSPSVYTYFPLPPRLPALVAVHDAIAERFPRLTLPSARARLFWRAKVALALRQARLVLTVSDFAARELTEVLHVPAERIRVAGEAPAAAYRPSETAAESTDAARRHGVPAGARWLVYVGGFNPHKRVTALVRAHARVLERRPDEPLYLLLVGTTTGDVFHGELDAIRAEIERAGTGHRVLWTGFVDDEELRHLHSGAVALVLPSECEGFGLPAVEAAACGTPVVATRRSPLPELLEGGGVWVEPNDADALADAIERLAGDDAYRCELGRTARRRADALGWRDSAARVLDALREAAS